MGLILETFIHPLYFVWAIFKILIQYQQVICFCHNNVKIKIY